MRRQRWNGSGATRTPAKTSQRGCGELYSLALALSPKNNLVHPKLLCSPGLGPPLWLGATLASTATHPLTSPTSVVVVVVVVVVVLGSPRPRPPVPPN